MKTVKLHTTVVALLALATSAFAQGGFTLFGESGPELTGSEKFVRPISAPYFHEDSFVTTDLRAWVVYHEFEDGSGADAIDGDVTVYALQVRLALTQSLQFVAYKDGYTDFNDTALNDADVVSDGWNDIGAGIKWAFYQNWEKQLHMAVGIGYEFGVGDEDVLQDTNELRLWGSFNKGFEKLHIGGTANFIVADSEGEGRLGNSDMLTLHAHADYYLCEWFSPVVELNAYMVTSGDTQPFSGVDAVSLNGGEDNDTYTCALGGEFRPLGDDFGIRVAYETGLNSNESLFGDRWTFSAVYEF